MPWLLPGIYAVRSEELGPAALVGALLYGIAFTYLAHTTLHALQAQTPNYEVLWQQLGPAYAAQAGQPDASL